MMKFTNLATGEELDAKKYAMPVKGTEFKLNVNGEDLVGKITEGRGQAYSYFTLKNISMYVPGKLEDGGRFELATTEGFGSDTPPVGRKSYYKSKKVKNEDGSIVAGEGANQGEDVDAARTVGDGTADEHAEFPDGTKVDPLAEGQVTAPPEGSEETHPDGTPVSPKNRSKRVR